MTKRIYSVTIISFFAALTLCAIPIGVFIINWNHQVPWISIIIGLCISLLAAYLTQNHLVIKTLKNELEAKKLETHVLVDELRQTIKRAEQTHDTKTFFLTNMSYEIQAPINGIVGFSEKAMDEALPEETREYLRKIKTSAAGLKEIVNDLLDISKAEIGHIELDHMPVDLSAVLKACKDSFSLAAQEKGIRLNFQLSPEIGVKVMSDPTRLRQIFNNLLSNAIRFTDEGYVTFKAEAITGDQKLTVLYEVKDSGLGMTEEQIKTIMKPFTQIYSLMKPSDRMGFGLFIARDLIQLMGGHLQAESVPGIGSRFYFALRFDLVDRNTDY